MGAGAAEAVAERNASQRRIGSAVSDGSCRMVMVSVAVSSISSSRSRYFSSSRTLGRVKSSAGMRCAPRSSATTLSPALVSSRAMMLPVQPTPTRTASTAFIVLAMIRPLQLKSAIDCGSMLSFLPR